MDKFQRIAQINQVFTPGYHDAPVLQTEGERIDWPAGYPAALADKF